MGSALCIYTDGSSIWNPWQGWWAFLVLENKGTHILHKDSGGESYTTNNRMELTSVIQAMLYASDHGYCDENIIVYMDSMYVHDGITKYLPQWIRRWWRLANKRPVQNKDLWVLLNTLFSKFHNLSVQWVKAHASNKYNNIVDDLAREAALRMPISQGEKTLCSVSEETNQPSLF